MAAISKENFGWLEWVVSVIVISLAVGVWFSVRIHPGVQLTVYDIFPLFGLYAFSLMWTQFVMGTVRKRFDLKFVGHDYYMALSAGVVLALIVAHPGLLWYGLWRDGFGLPPASYLKVYSTQVLAVLLGSVSLCIFLSYEFRRFFGRKKWWKFVEYGQILAMVLIFFHALILGNELKVGWFRVIWYLYGLTLVVSWVYNYWYVKQQNRLIKGGK